MFKAEAARWILEEIDTQRPVIERDALEHDPSSMVDPSTHRPDGTSTTDLTEPIDASAGQTGSPVRPARRWAVPNPEMGRAASAFPERRTRLGLDAFSVYLERDTKLRGHQTGRLGRHNAVGTFKFEHLGRSPAHRNDALVALLSVDEHFTASTPVRPVKPDDVVLTLELKLPRFVLHVSQCAQAGVRPNFAYYQATEDRSAQLGQRSALLDGAR